MSSSSSEQQLTPENLLKNLQTLQQLFGTKKRKEPNSQENIPSPKIHRSEISSSSSTNVSEQVIYEPIAPKESEIVSQEDPILNTTTSPSPSSPSPSSPPSSSTSSVSFTKEKEETKQSQVTVEDEDKDEGKDKQESPIQTSSSSDISLSNPTEGTVNTTDVLNIDESTVSQPAETPVEQSAETPSVQSVIIPVISEPLVENTYVSSSSSSSSSSDSVDETSVKENNSDGQVNNSIELLQYEAAILHTLIHTIQSLGCQSYLSSERDVKSLDIQCTLHTNKTIKITYTSNTWNYELIPEPISLNPSLNSMKSTIEQIPIDSSGVEFTNQLVESIDHPSSISPPPQQQEDEKELVEEPIDAAVMNNMDTTAHDNNDRTDNNDNDKTDDNDDNDDNDSQATENDTLSANTDMNVPIKSISIVDLTEEEKEEVQPTAAAASVSEPSLVDSTSKSKESGVSGDLTDSDDMSDFNPHPTWEQQRPNQTQSDQQHSQPQQQQQQQDEGNATQSNSAQSDNITSPARRRSSRLTNTSTSSSPSSPSPSSISSKSPGKKKPIEQESQSSTVSSTIKHPAGFASKVTINGEVITLTN